MKISRMATLLLLVMSIVATACVAPGAAPAPAGGNPGGATGGETQAGISGNVEFWHFWGSPVRRIVAICQEQLPNIQITETFKPFGDIWTANIAAVAAGTGMPDGSTHSKLACANMSLPLAAHPHGIG